MEIRQLLESRRRFAPPFYQSSFELKQPNSTPLAAVKFVQDATGDFLSHRDQFPSVGSILGKSQGDGLIRWQQHAGSGQPLKIVGLCSRGKKTIQRNSAAFTACNSWSNSGQLVTFPPAGSTSSYKFQRIFQPASPLLSEDWCRESTTEPTFRLTSFFKNSNPNALLRKSPCLPNPAFSAAVFPH